MIAITFENITAKNKDIALALHVGKEQESFVEDVATCLLEAEEYSLWHPVLILVNDIAVGFAMYGLYLDDDKKNRVWLDRYMIDERFQGKGYGKKSLPLLCTHIRKTLGHDTLYTNVYPHNSVAIKLYENAGFHINGEYDTKGELVMVSEQISS